MPHELKSSWLKHCDYDHATQTLIVTTVKGTEHKHRVSPEMFEALKSSDSPGQYYNANLRNR